MTAEAKAIAPAWAWVACPAVTHCIASHDPSWRRALPLLRLRIVKPEDVIHDIVATRLRGKELEHLAEFERVLLAVDLHGRGNRGTSPRTRE